MVTPVSLTGPWHVARLCIILAGASLVGRPAGGQTTGCEPIAQRAGREFGCFITARAELGALPRDSTFYWHIDAFSTRSKADAAETARGTVVSSLGRIWLFTIADSSWRPPGGERLPWRARFP